MAKQPPDISIVLPIYNEEANIEDLYSEITRVMDATGRSYEIVCCDDGSTDSSLAILGNIAGRDERVKVISFARNYGQTAALDTGFRLATGKVIVPMDADLQNDPADIPRLVERLDDGFDVVSGWRRKRRDAFWTKTLPSRVANLLVSWVTGIKLHDYGCTLKAYRASILKEFRLYGEMHRLIPAYVKSAGGTVAEEPVNHRPRRAGRSKYTLAKSIRLLLDLLTVKFLLQYSTKPLYFMGKFGLASLAAGACGMVAIGAGRVWRPGEADWSVWLVLSAMLVLAGIQFLLFGLLAELAIRIYYESEGRSPYLVRTRINLPEED